MLPTDVCSKPSEPVFRKSADFLRQDQFQAVSASVEAAGQVLATAMAGKPTMAPLPRETKLCLSVSLPKAFATSKLVLILLLLCVNAQQLLKSAL